MDESEDDVQHVVAAVIENSSGQVLLAKRSAHRHQGGLWEFPGGKLEYGEQPQEALFRELHEELGIFVRKCRPLIRVYHTYSDKSVMLDVWKVTEYSGELHGREGQPVEWVSHHDLPSRKFPDANQPIVTAARLPSLYLVTPEPVETVKFLKRLEALLSAGVSLVQFRAKTLDSGAYALLAKQVASLCSQAGARLLLNAPPSIVEELGIDGVHLTSARLMALKKRPLNREQLVAASCHSEEELDHACRIGVDFVVIAPVLVSTSHPLARPLGWQNLFQLTERSTVPVYALGGMKLNDMTTAWDHGCQGIASISSLWAAEKLPHRLYL